jgi:hypothetical protein
MQRCLLMNRPLEGKVSNLKGGQSFPLARPQELELSPPLLASTLEKLRDGWFEFCNEPDAWRELQ